MLPINSQENLSIAGISNHYEIMIKKGQESFNFKVWYV